MLCRKIAIRFSVVLWETINLNIANSCYRSSQKRSMKLTLIIRMKGVFDIVETISKWWFDFFKYSSPCVIKKSHRNNIVSIMSFDQHHVF